MNKPKTRFNLRRFNRMIVKVTGLLRDAFAQEMHHEKLSDLFHNGPEIQGHADWSRMTQWERRYLQGMHEGAKKAWFASQIIVWAHFFEGEYRTATECQARHPEDPYLYITQLDPTQSAWVWSRHRNVYIGPKKN